MAGFESTYGPNWAIEGSQGQDVPPPQAAAPSHGQGGYQSPAGGHGHPGYPPQSYGQPSYGGGDPNLYPPPQTGVYRWIFAYFLGCLVATPIVMTGMILSFNAGGELGQSGIGFAMLVCMIMFPFFLILIMLVGILPTVPTYFTMKEWNRVEAFSYMFAGFLAWGLFGFFLSALAELSVALNVRQGQPASEVSMLGLTLTAALAGSCVLALLWALSIRGNMPPPPQDTPPPPPPPPSGRGGGRPPRQPRQPRQERNPTPQAYDPQVPFL